MKDILIGCGQITWRGVEEEVVLREIAAAGYAGAPAGPSAGRTTAETLALYAANQLKPAPGYLGAEFWNPEQEAKILERARDYASFAQQAGVTELYIAASGMDRLTGRGLTRRQVAGHVQPADRMSDEEYTQFARVLNQVGEITLARGVRSCFHNHVGTVIETRAEIDHLWSLVDRDRVFMGPDTGHLAWGGADVLEFCRDYADSIKTLHIKDIDPTVLAEGVAGGWDYPTFSQRGIFTELGQGLVDFPALFELLAEAGFSGWLIVETDVTQLPTPLESARVSRAYLASLGY